MILVLYLSYMCTGAGDEPALVNMQVRIVQHAFEIVNLLTDSNPIQVLVDAIINRYSPLPTSHNTQRSVGTKFQQSGSGPTVALAVYDCERASHDLPLLSGFPSGAQPPQCPSSAVLVLVFCNHQCVACTRLAAASLMLQVVSELNGRNFHELGSTCEHWLQPWWLVSSPKSQPDVNANRHSVEDTPDACVNACAAAAPGKMPPASARRV